ncbi:hypothetical protein [Armatimonas rosea]|uniref:Uncharacterized protein n=1 Tax=Armatimonas rosea TaxID=685828 RepID=A0A7W9W8U2_ARMRO|nr:hypothetical protein [Armatimonas rosea]MBB6053929.1 hypothetical protein [Armatimonas rosea]
MSQAHAPSSEELEVFRGYAESFQALARQALPLYTDTVNTLIRDECRDRHQIEYTLDHLLDFCYDAKMLVLYKRLCRYYFPLDPEATVSYIHAYRDLWDSDSEDRESNEEAE